MSGPSSPRRSRGRPPWLLTPAEKAMVDAVREGREIDLAPYAGKGETKAAIRAEVLRALILQLCDDRLIDPKGIQIRNARIKEQLDLAFCSVKSPIRLAACEIGDTCIWSAVLPAGNASSFVSEWPDSWFRVSAMRMDGARLLSLEVEDSVLHAPVFAELCMVESSISLRGTTCHAPIWFRGARVCRLFSCVNTTERLIYSRPSRTPLARWAMV